jgi:hypothetical protein
VRNAGTEVPAYLRDNSKNNDKGEMPGLKSRPISEATARTEARATTSANAVISPLRITMKP